VLDDGGDGDKTPPSAHATAEGRSIVSGGLHGLAALLPSAKSERSDARAAVLTLLAATNAVIVWPLVAPCAESPFHYSGGLGGAQSSSSRK
jgi:hypothetical protein